MFVYVKHSKFGMSPQWSVHVLHLPGVFILWAMYGLGFFHLCLSENHNCPSMCFCVSHLEFDCSGQNLTYVPAIHEGNKQIHSLTLSFNHLQKLVDNNFQNMDNLRVLRLDYNNMQTIKQKAFHNLHNLEVLSLQGNLLQSLRPALFQNLFQLRILDLSNNNLKTLDPHIFHDTGALKYLDLRNNKIQAIENATFLPLTQLQELVLAQNPLSHLYSTTFQELTQLMVLNLSQMGITSLDSDLFWGLSHLNNLDLSENSITTLDPSSIQNLSNLKLLNLSGNPLLCDCKMIPLANWTRGHTGIVWSSENAATCSEPNWLSGEHFHSVPLSQFICPNPSLVRRPSRKNQKVKDRLPYNKMMGWYTAAALSGMLVLFLLCLILDKIKRHFHRWRKARKDRQAKYKYSDGPSRYTSLYTARNSIDFMDSVSNVFNPNYQENLPRTVINTGSLDYDHEPGHITLNMTNPAMEEDPEDNFGNGPEMDGALVMENRGFSTNGTCKIPREKSWENFGVVGKELKELETSM